MNKPLRALALRTAPLLVAGIIVGGLVEPAAASRMGPGDDADNVAHRGSSGVVPENTIAAVERALAQRADVIENDIQRTADGELVIMHDTTLARTTDVEQVFPDRAPWSVGSFTLAEIKQLDAGSWFSADFAGERVPTLREWVEAVGNRAGMLLEPKAPELYPGIEIDLDKELRSLPEFTRALRRDPVVVQAFTHPWLKAYQDLAPDVPTGLLFGAAPTQAEIDAASMWAEQVNPALGAIGEETVTAVHAAGMEIHVWTVNGGQDMRRALAWQVDGIITNYPQVLAEILRER